MKTQTPMSHQIGLAKSLAPEDIRCGDMVAVLDMVYELPSFLWQNSSHMLSPDEPVCIRMRGEHTGRPLKVKAVCLPYVLLKYPDGRYRTLDMRRCRLVRLSKSYAKAAWRGFRKKRKKKDS